MIIHDWNPFFHQPLEPIRSPSFDDAFNMGLDQVASEIRYLVGGFKHFLSSIIYGIILPID
jgi:hypothetical protein